MVLVLCRQAVPTISTAE